MAKARSEAVGETQSAQAICHRSAPRRLPARVATLNSPISGRRGWIQCSAETKASGKAKPRRLHAERSSASRRFEETSRDTPRRARATLSVMFALQYVIHDLQFPYPGLRSALLLGRMAPPCAPRSALPVGRPANRTPTAFARRSIPAGPLRSVLLLGPIALRLLALRRALPAGRFAVSVLVLACPRTASASPLSVLARDYPRDCYGALSGHSHSAGLPTGTFVTGSPISSGRSARTSLTVRRSPARSSTTSYSLPRAPPNGAGRRASSPSTAIRRSPGSRPARCAGEHG